MKERLGKLVDNGYENMTLVAIKEMGNELSRLRSYVAAVAPLVEAAREYQYAVGLISVGEVGCRGAEQSQKDLLDAAMNLKLEVPRG